MSSDFDATVGADVDSLLGSSGSYSSQGFVSGMLPSEAAHMHLVQYQTSA
jgi:hypothetical protein